MSRLHPALNTWGREKSGWGERRHVPFVELDVPPLHPAVDTRSLAVEGTSVESQKRGQDSKKQLWGVTHREGLFMRGI